MHFLPTTHAVIPAAVRYDTALTPAARLLYGEITALCAQRGYCWATNDYFARLYQVRRNTISLWVQTLVERGHLVATIDPTRGNQRRLRPAADLSTPSPDFSVPSPENSGEDTRIFAPPIPKNMETYPEISFTEMQALLLGKKNDNKEWEREASPAPELEVKVELHPNGADAHPIPPVARPPLPAPPPARPAAPDPGFTRPELPQVIAFFTAQPDTPAATATAEATRFFNYYQANGWRVGRHPMADWPAAARNWLLNADRFKTPATAPAAGPTARLHSGGAKSYHEPL